MRIEVKYKSVWVAILLAALFISLYLFNFYSMVDTSYNAIQQLNIYAQGSILGELLLQLQQTYPIINSIVLLILLFIGSLTLNKFTIQNNLFGVATKLPSIIYVLVCLASFSAPIVTMPAIAAMLVSLALYSLYTSTKNHHDTASLFASCIYLGIIPLLYPSMVLLLPICIFTMLVTNTNSYRDAATAYIGIILPLVIGVVAKGLVGDESVLYECAKFMNSTVAQSPYEVEWLSITPIFVGLIALLSIAGLLQLDGMSMRYSLRRLIKTSNIWLLLSLSLVAIPTFSFEMLAIVSAPVSLLVTAALLHVRSGFKSILIVVILTACFVANALYSLLM